MEEILRHLGCIKPCKQRDIYHINWCRICFHQQHGSSIVFSLARFRHFSHGQVFLFFQNSYDSLALQNDTKIPKIHRYTPCLVVLPWCFAGRFLIKSRSCAPPSRPGRLERQDVCFFPSKNAIPSVLESEPLAVTFDGWTLST